MAGPMFLLAIALLGAPATESSSCGDFDLVQLGIDLRSGYFEAAGMEMAKTVISDLARQLECERDSGSLKEN